MERPRARSGTGCSLVGPGRCGDSGGAGRAGRSRSATASAHGSAPAPISFRSDRQRGAGLEFQRLQKRAVASRVVECMLDALLLDVTGLVIDVRNAGQQAPEIDRSGAELDRKSTRLNSSHTVISYAVFCLKKKKKKKTNH